MFQLQFPYPPISSPNFNALFESNISLLIFSSSLFLSKMVFCALKISVTSREIMSTYSSLLSSFICLLLIDRYFISWLSALIILMIYGLKDFFSAISSNVASTIALSSGCTCLNKSENSGLSLGSRPNKR